MSVVGRLNLCCCQDSLKHWVPRKIKPTVTTRFAVPRTTFTPRHFHVRSFSSVSCTCYEHFVISPSAQRRSLVLALLHCHYIINVRDSRAGYCPPGVGSSAVVVVGAA